ncbi:Vitamin B12 import ATP-binding protein BtuD [Dyadobacter sp. CECT 9623]|uniref:Vitamin B12 import ATP-binding protein BtuD n=1 Tax=Dyadobacter linearis TaxID=2823330 RepID=A0ABM8UPX6_9BACT|nr:MULTISPECIES: ATP-binding cassette domain-containing protein [unclassified Dyadobacter]MCE7058967.1 ATP-binding cassette domain-containing protein [Dyadobacter sp. CY343]CAG5069556.1 Vitamin B12 import ATP-binding protein BtuD [Dyadobacter sp. CECT 9623]
MNIIEVRNVTKEYSNHIALDDVSISIPRGQIFGLLGPNGAGKTSLIRIINQITGPDKGEILFDGQRLNDSHISRIGYLPEERGLYKKMKVGDQLLYLAQLKGLSQKEALEKLKVWFVKFDIKTWWDKSVSDLSKGMQQKVQFVSTVLHEPDLIILDEPFSGFDPINANLIRDEILELKQKGSTIIFSTHRMETVEELCDHIALIHKSKKVLDGPKNVIKEQFKTHTYFVEYRGSLTGQNGFYEVSAEKELENEYRRATIHLEENRSPNELLASLLPYVEIRSFGENIPSMSEIFMRSVNEIPEA